MNHHQMKPALFTLFIFFLILSGGCRSEKSKEANSASSGKDAPSNAGESIEAIEIEDTTRSKPPNYGEILQPDERISLSDGKLDLLNKYSSTVITEITTPTGENVACSGVVIRPHIVLTAGHCVCMRHEVTTPEDGVESIIDNKQCVKVAKVTTELYNLQTKDSVSIRDKTPQTHTGRVQPHPGLNIPLNRQAEAISSTADLAIIILDTPVREEVPAIQLAPTDVKVGESIIMAGYGYDSISDLIYGTRHFGIKKVTGFLKPGTVLFEQLGAAFTSGSGEPCLRKVGTNVFLVGITSRDVDGTPIFTSTHLHQAWLRTEIENADKSTPHGSP